MYTLILLQVMLLKKDGFLLIRNIVYNTYCNDVHESVTLLNKFKMVNTWPTFVMTSFSGMFAMIASAMLLGFTFWPLFFRVYDNKPFME